MQRCRRVCSSIHHHGAAFSNYLAMISGLASICRTFIWAATSVWIAATLWQRKNMSQNRYTNSEIVTVALGHLWVLQTRSFLNWIWDGKVSNKVWSKKVGQKVRKGSSCEASNNSVNHCRHDRAMLCSALGLLARGEKFLQVTRWYKTTIQNLA